MGWDLFGLTAPSENYPKAKQAAQRALEMDPNCAEAHAALGYMAGQFDWDWATAEREFRHAIDLKPQYGPAHIWYSHLLRAMDRTEESLAESRRALECDPLGLVLNMHMGWHLVYSRQYEKAIEQCLKTLELDPTFILAHVFLGQAYEQIGAFSERRCGIRKGRRAVQSPPDISGGSRSRTRRGWQTSGCDERCSTSCTRCRHSATSRREAIAEIHIGLG